MKIAIIGFGRFGKLFAQIVKPFGEVYALTESPINDTEIRRLDLEGLREMDWVIPAVPISALPATLKKIREHLQPGVLLMDVCSVKVLPCQWLLEWAPASASLLGSHPMFGPDSAKNGLENLEMVFTPVRIDEAKLTEIKKVFAGLGLKIIVTSAEDHDRQAAKCLSMVHFLGRALARLPIEPQSITTLGFERLLAVNETVSNDSWQLFLDMQKYNPFIKEIRGKLIEVLCELDQEIIAAEENQD